MTATTLEANFLQSRGDLAAAFLASEGHPHSPEPLGESIFVRAGAPLFHQEDNATCLYKVVEGAVRAFTFTEDGRRQINGFHFCGDTFGSGQSGQYRSSAETITDCSLIRYRRRQQEADPRPGFNQFMLEVALGEIRAAEQQILLLGRMSACSKVAAFLLHLAERFSLDKVPGVVIRIPMTRYDIADYLGLSAESVSRCFTKMKQRGMIACGSPSEIELVDIETLSDVPRGL